MMLTCSCLNQQALQLAVVLLRAGWGLIAIGNVND
jgi:hypothetical protein